MNLHCEEDGIFVRRLSPEEFEMFYRGSSPEIVEPEIGMEVESNLKCDSMKKQKKDLLIQYCRGDSLNDCDEVVLNRIEYDEPFVPWKCQKHMTQETTCDKEPENIPSPRESRIPRHWSDILFSNDNQSEDTISHKTKLYDPKFIVPKSILNNDAPGTLHVYCFRTPNESPNKPVYYYKIGEALDVKAAQIPYLHHCSKFRELKFKKKYPIITRLNSYSTDQYHTLMYKLHGNLVKNDFEVLGKKKSAMCMGCHASHMEWYSITKEKGDALKSVKEPNPLYPGWHFIHVLILQLIGKV